MLVEQTSKMLKLLLTDIVMPGMDGTALHRRLCRNNGPIPVLFVSGYPELRSGPSQKLDSDAHFMQKPFSPASLVRTVRTILDG